MLPRNKDNTEKQSGTLLCRMGLLAAFTLLPAPGRAQSPARAQPPAAGKKTGGYTINVDVNLVVLHATVIDKSGRPVNDLKQGKSRGAVALWGHCTTDAYFSGLKIVPAKAKTSG